MTTQDGTQIHCKDWGIGQPIVFSHGWPLTAPRTLIVWDKNDSLFATAGAHAYERDLKHAELHLLNTGHIALEEESATIATHIITFLAKQKL